jgi:hypothetical protein
MQNISQRINLSELPKISQTTKTSNNELSIYQGGQLTQAAVIRETEKIFIAFPKIEAQMVSLLRERFKANGFNDERMSDAINFVIDNYRAWDKLPAIADFVSFDKTVKVYTYGELMTKHKDAYYMGATYDPIANEYDQINFYGEQRFAKKEDVERYRLQKWEYKKKS